MPVWEEGQAKLFCSSENFDSQSKKLNHHEKKYMSDLVQNMFFTGTDGPFDAGLLQVPFEGDIFLQAQGFRIPG
jgi:hypothetical protein